MRRNTAEGRAGGAATSLRKPVMFAVRYPWCHLLETGRIGINGKKLSQRERIVEAEGVRVKEHGTK
jgi:hypothetical protein